MSIMVRVSVYKQANYPISSPKVKKFLRNFFVKKGIVSRSEVSVAFVGKKKMLAIAGEYLKDGQVHNVLSFTPDEMRANFVYPPDGKIHLGEIIICYPKVVADAKKENKLIESKVHELVEHGARHLLGEHHH